MPTMKIVTLFSMLHLFTFLSFAQTFPLSNMEATRWVKEGEWNNGWNITPHKSINCTEFQQQYHKNKDVWDRVFHFLANNDLSTLSIGKHSIIDNSCWAIVSEYTPKNLEEGNIESHRKFIDLQYVIRGKEYMGIAKRANVRNEYNEKKDVAFYNSKKIKYYSADNNTFFLFFPSDIHQPSVCKKQTNDINRKIVIKVEYL